MDIIDILELIGGVGLFLFGMNLMGSSLEKLAGSGLSKILEKLTSGKSKLTGRIKGWALGLGVTGIIQSSAATTIMLIGFVNAGIMKLAAAIPVVFGANVGSTVTAQILRLGDLGSGSIILTLLKPASFAPMLAAVGAAMHMFSKKKKTKDIAGILLGLGILFYGMTRMEAVFAPLKESESFKKLFTSFENPFLGILAGLVLTAIIQSSSASVGILQALSATGSVTMATAVPIIIGQNIGKCMTIILGSVGANKKAKRVSLSYLLFNILGAIFFTVIIYSIYYTVGIPMFAKAVNRGDIANIHLLFNLIMSLLLLPFTDGMVKLTRKLVKDTDSAPVDEWFSKLDNMLLKTPAVALTQCRELVTELIERLKESYSASVNQISHFRAEVYDRLYENEAFFDRCETELTSYLLQINKNRLNEDDRNTIDELLGSISDFERIGDYSISIALTAKDMHERGMKFSPTGMNEIYCITAATSQCVHSALNSFLENDTQLAIRTEPLTEVIDKLKELIRSHHVDRLQKGDCGIEGGISLFDIMTCLERISAHAANIAMHVVKRNIADSDFDELHGHAGDRNSEEYRAIYCYFETQFITPVIEASIENKPDKNKSDNEKSDKDKSEKDKSDNNKPDKDKSDKYKSDINKSEKDKPDKNKSEKDKSGKEKSGKEKSDKEKSDKEKSGKEKQNKDSKSGKKKS